MKQYNDEIQGLLKSVVEHFEKEDSTIRERQIRTWRRLKLLWEGFSQVWYSEVAHDWRIYDESQSEDTDQSSYDKPVNVFRAYLESIIAALSVTVPPIKCFPDDADNTLDLSTAKAGDKIAQLVYRHNDVPLLWLHGLFIYATEGMVACYSYPKSDKEYGEYEIKKYDDLEEEQEITTCPECGYEINNQPVEMGAPPLEQPQPMADPMMQSELQGIEPDFEDLINEFDPGQSAIELRDAILNDDRDLCPACMAMISPEIKREKFIVQRLVGVTKEPKSRIALEVYGGLHVKVPNYAKTIRDVPALIYSYETHYSNVLERYKHLNNETTSRTPSDLYDQYGRISPQYQGEVPDNVVTMRNAWLRPASFNVLPKEEAAILKKEFPDGAKVILSNDDFAEACNENLDDHWTLTHNPLSDHLHHDPLGLLLVSIQEITNDLLSLILQTIEHGIPQTFADPGVLDFKAYQETEVVPGGIFPAIPKSGKTVGEAFHEVKTATLSAEVLPFAQNVQQLAQLVSGALPSLFGGQVEGSGTASEYSMSRAQALQRLQNTWKFFTIWWKTIFGKVIPMYIKEVKEDERTVERDKDGNFINILIKRAELEGKIGRVELEANENLPLTWSQQKDIVMTLLQANNPQILEIIGSPENLPIIRQAIGLIDFFIPGEDDRDAELDEIKLLLNSEPMVVPTDPMMMEQAAMMGQELPPEQEIPSIEIDMDIDNHRLRFEIDRKWLISEAGRAAKIDNPQGYKNVLLHARLHKQAYQQEEMMMMASGEESGAVPPEKPNENTQVPIQGEGDVTTMG